MQISAGCFWYNTGFDLLVPATVETHTALADAVQQSIKAGGYRFSVSVHSGRRGEQTVTLSR